LPYGFLQRGLLHVQEVYSAWRKVWCPAHLRAVHSRFSCAIASPLRFFCTSIIYYQNSFLIVSLCLFSCFPWEAVYAGTILATALPLRVAHYENDTVVHLRIYSIVLSR
jgi:hypothetical protein